MQREADGDRLMNQRWRDIAGHPDLKDVEVMELCKRIADGKYDGKTEKKRNRVARKNLCANRNLSRTQQRMVENMLTDMESPVMMAQNPSWDVSGLADIYCRETRIAWTATTGF